MSREKLAGALAAAVGRENVIIDRDVLEKYSRDETSDLFCQPDIVVRARSAADVSSVFKVCGRYKTPVTPRGAGTGVTGGAIPVRGGVVLSLEMMNRILEIDCENMVAVVEPGVITRHLQDAALEKGLMYPPDPASLDSCSIGGNVAEGAGGPRAVKYGTTKDYIIGLEFVLPDGTIMNTGGKIVKNATGYNLIGILTGSEGTLAVITRIYLRLIPAPGAVLDLLVPFRSIGEALDLVSKLILAKIVPAAVEFMDEDAVGLVKNFLKEEMPFPDAGALILIQMDGESEDEIMGQLEKIKTHLSDDRVFAASAKSQRERLWKARRSVREAVEHESRVFLSEDTVVPRSEIGRFLTEVKKYFNSMGLSSAMFGHAGDGNVHIDVLRRDMDYEKWKELVPEIKKGLYKIAIGHGGTLTGEHGVGVLRRDYLGIALSVEQIELLKRIKAAFDPQNILNPGKIF